MFFFKKLKSVLFGFKNVIYSRVGKAVIQVGNSCNTILQYYCFYCIFLSNKSLSKSLNYSKLLKHTPIVFVLFTTSKKSYAQSVYACMMFYR